MKTTYFGEIGFQAWEILLLPILFATIFVIAAQIKNRNIQTAPYFRFLLPGMFAKVFGGIFFGCVYVYYYQGGDTVSYYESSLAFSNLIQKSPYEGLEALFSPYSKEVRGLFDHTTGYPLSYIHSDISTFTVVRFVTPILMLSMESYLITTVLIACISFVGIWKAFALFQGYYPQLTRQLAIAFLFVPSVIFWGSGILKDTITLSAACWFIVGIHGVFIVRRRVLMKIVSILVASYLLIAIKPYIFMVLIPGTLIWVLFRWLQGLKSRFARILLIPFIYLATAGLGVLLFSVLGNVLNEYSLQNIVDKAIVTQTDLKQDYYGQNSFDIGELDPTFIGIVSKAPIAILFGLFTPFLWNVNNIVMLFSALENSILLVFVVWILFRVGFVRIARYIFKDPVLIFTLSFAVLFALALGLTTPNYGALVRFKIPLIPFFVASLFILQHLRERKLKKVPFVPRPANPVSEPPQA
ncbi:MAG: hypothetical protein ACFB10_04170 [Salibacteraceae bacterium]